MLGAIVGDIVGSQFEHTNYLSKSFELFSPECSFSDDTVLTLAVCQALLETETKPELLPQAAERHLADFANRYWKLSYGGQFNRWRISELKTPYFSCGNGAAMRVSGCGYAAKTLDEVFALADAVTAVTHNHPEGLNGAKAVAASVFLARTGHDKASVKTSSVATSTTSHSRLIRSARHTAAVKHSTSVKTRCRRRCYVSSSRRPSKTPSETR